MTPMKGIKKVYIQTGKRKSKIRDRGRLAMPPGWRKSKAGKFYFEARKNRSDLKGSSL